MFNWNKELFDQYVKSNMLSLQTRGGLHLYNYTRNLQVMGWKNQLVWNQITLACRGLILDWENQETVAWPLTKFFNWFESGRYTTAHMVHVTKKMDGSCGILYRDNGLAISTRGSFQSDQAIWATDFLNKGYYDLSLIPDELTLVFEIIYPDNQVVVDYGETEDLVLLFARNRHTGQELARHELVSLSYDTGFNLVEQVSANNMTELLERAGTLPSSEEGWVVYFSDGQRFKVKGDEYCEIHKLLSSFTEKNIKEAWKNGKDQEFRNNLPEEFFSEFDTIIDEVEGRYREVVSLIEYAWDNRPQRDLMKDYRQNRKAFAEYVFSTDVPRAYHGILFMLYTGQDGIDKAIRSNVIK